MILNKLVELDIISSPDYWFGFLHVSHLETLMKNAAKDGVCDKRIDNGIRTVDIALRVLTQAKVISDVRYWENLIKSDTIKYLGQLIINIANRVRDILERIVWAEARGESLVGQELVANVVLNRHRSSKFNYSGIYNVVFAPNQFTPITNGAYDAAVPSASVKMAVTNVLNGKDGSMGALYFRTIRGAAGSWHERSLAKLFDHGAHRFYR